MRDVDLKYVMHALPHFELHVCFHPEQADEISPMAKSWTIPGASTHDILTRYPL